MQSGSVQRYCIWFFAGTLGLTLCYSSSDNPNAMNILSLFPLIPLGR